MATVSGTRSNTEADRLAWLALALTPGMGATRVLRAISRTVTPSDILHMSLTELESLALPAASAQFVCDGKAQLAAESELQRASDGGAGILTHDCPLYPQRLKEIYDPPPVLWYRGDPALLGMPSLAVVGTRHPSPYGIGMAQLLSRDLAARGMVILSGMARGIDTEAHKGALQAKGKTVAVWGTGIDVIYPKENKRLAEQILDGGGCLLTEFATGTFPAPQNFPMRNRVLSGMSLGVLVVEAAENSGTRITSRCAMEQNRDVYAVPGNVTNKNAWVPNTLIKQGAKLTATWEDVWEDLPSYARLEMEDRLAAQNGSAPNQSVAGSGATLFLEQEMSPTERLVYSHLRADSATQLDELIERLEAELPSAEIFTALFELELASRVRQMPGKNYVRTI